MHTVALVGHGIPKLGEGDLHDGVLPSLLQLLLVDAKLTSVRDSLAWVPSPRCTQVRQDHASLVGIVLCVPLIVVKAERRGARRR